MRVNRFTCPHCQTTLTSKAGVEVGASLNCPKCKKKFAIEAPEEEEVVEDFDVVDEEEEAPKKAPLAKPPLAKKKPRDEDEEDKPKAKKKSQDDDDDDKPRKKKKKKRDEEEELSGYGKLKSNVYVRVSVLAVLLGTFGVLAYFMVKKYNKDSDANSTSTVKNEDDDLGKPIDPNRERPKVVPKKDAKKEVDQRMVGKWKSRKTTVDDIGVLEVELKGDGSYTQRYTAADGMETNTAGTWWLVSIHPNTGDSFLERQEKGKAIERFQGILTKKDSKTTDYDSMAFFLTIGKTSFWMHPLVPVTKNDQRD